MIPITRLCPGQLIVTNGRKGIYALYAEMSLQSVGCYLDCGHTLDDSDVLWLIIAVVWPKMYNNPVLFLVSQKGITGWARTNSDVDVLVSG